MNKRRQRSTRNSCRNGDPSVGRQNADSVATMSDASRPVQPRETQHIAGKRPKSNSNTSLFLLDREDIAPEGEEQINPADNIAVPPKFKAKSMMNIHEDRRSGSSAMRGQRASSTSNIYIDDSTVSKPNAKAMQKCLALAIYYHVKSNNHADDLSSNVPDIFDEQKHPLRKKKNQKPVDSQSDLVSIACS